MIPATQNLFEVPSGLLNYQPVIIDLQSPLNAKVIAYEYALLEYESEAIYKDYREPPIGKMPIRALT